MIANSTVPMKMRSKYMNGECVAFALAMHRQLELPIYALVDRSGDKEFWIHAFVADEANGIAVDVRGVLEFAADEVSEGAAINGTPAVRLSSADEIQRKLFSYPSASDIKAARAIVARHIGPLVKDVVVSNALLSGPMKP